MQHEFCGNFSVPATCTTEFNRGTCRRHKIAAKRVMHGLKIIMQDTRGDESPLHLMIMSLLHVPATRLSYMSPTCEKRMILLLLHVAVGGAVAQWFVRWTPDRTVRVQASAGTLRCVLGQDTSLS